ncbi:MAG: alpha/beta fold hydrolase [Xanthomonadales bacterium]|nr:alpha/beta fold hydrolase [Xanthomonadales bacterium]
MTQVWLVLAVVAVVLYLVWAWRNGSPWLVRLLVSLEQRRVGLSKAQIQADGIEFQYLHDGEGATPAAKPDDQRPILVLIHGFGGDANHWLGIAPLLTPHFQLYMPEVPGYGETAFPSGGELSIDAQSQRLAAFIDAIGIEQCYVAGNSMGGYLAAMLGQQIPEKIRALWLLNPAGVHGAELTPLIAEATEEHGDNALIPMNFIEFERLRRSVFVTPPLLPRPVAASVIRRCQQRIRLYKRLFEAMCFASTPLDNFAAQLTMPVLLVWGDEDRVLHPSAAPVLEQLVPNIQSVMMKNMGHCPMIEAPEPSAKDFERFVKSLGNPLTSPKG